MSTEVKVPTLGESVAEATIGEWLKQPGEAVALDEPIASLETDKVAVEVTAPVAGVMLGRVLKQMKYGASVAAIGLAGGAAIEGALITPFILRGVNLLGIDSVMQPYANRLRAWERIARDLPMAVLESMVETATLADLPRLGADILQGKVRGRVVVDVNG